MEAGAGLGAVLILRWYWWRINAWSEITAMIAPFVGYLIGNYFIAPQMGEAFIVHKGTFYFTVIFTTVSWIVVTFATPPTSWEVLEQFVKQISPDGAWKKVYQRMGVAVPTSNLGLLTLLWLAAIVMTYSSLFAFGKFLFQDYSAAGIWGIVAAIGLGVLSWGLKKLKW
jgi:hypothetical protein